MLTTQRSLSGTTRAAPALRPIAVPVAFLAFHVVLGLVGMQSSAVATAHGVVAILAGFALAFLAARIDLIVAAAGYIAMCDVFWRMTGSRMPWEAGKYGLIAILLIAFFRFVKRPRKAGAPLFFIALLIPACVLTLTALGVGGARDQISLNLAGPIALAVAVLWFRQIVAEEGETTRLLWLLLGPVVAVSSIATWSTLSAGTIDFKNGSNFTTAGGFGPNQVSDILGAGALLCLLLALGRTRATSRAAQLALGVWFAGQAALTFSRGGLYSVGIAIVAMAMVAIATSGMRSKALTAVIVAVLAGVLAYASLNSFTDGSLGVRFTETKSTGRSDLAEADIALWAENPLLGVGPGVAKNERQTTTLAEDLIAKSHTEYTRLLSEHGVLGLAAIAILFGMAISAVRDATTRWNRLLAAAFAAWALFSMVHSGTSIGAISLFFGLACLRLKRDQRGPATPALAQTR